MPSDQYTFTYQTRCWVDAPADHLLIQMAEILSSAERRLFKDLSTGKKISDLKADYIKNYQITARHFNAIRVQLEGKIASAKERQIAHASLLKEKIASLATKLTKLRNPHKVHQKKRLLFHLDQKLKKLQSAMDLKKISLCFGSKHLFQQQFHLEENKYQNHEEWLAKWQFTRNNSFFLIGSKDESQGNQSCTATIEEDKRLTLRIRLPNALGKYLLIPNIEFAYGHDRILQALQEGGAISYRLFRDEKGWRVFASLCIAPAALTTSSIQGVIGVDINVDHLALAETDRFGNPIYKKSIPLNTYGKNHHQSKALIGDVCSSIIALAKAKGKTVIVEKLDFAKKKRALKEEGCAKKSRQLSSFAYNSIKENLRAKGYREGIEVKEVNPAFTSLIGRIKFAKRYGLSIHQAAALSIGRRFLGASERIPRHLDQIPDGKGGYVALPVPERKRGEHVWSTWGKLCRKLQTVLAAHFRTKRSSSSKPTCVTDTIAEFAGETPAGESADSTARSACLNGSTLVFD
jgi:IS605 OrfB family transposase